MGLSTIILLAALLFAFSGQGIEASVVSQQEVQHQPLSHSTTHLLLHDNIYTTIREDIQLPNNSDFSGRLDGMYEMAAGSGGGSYEGDFSGTTEGSHTRVTFNFTVNGNSSMTGFSAKYSGGINGRAEWQGSTMQMNGNYAFNMNGTAQDQELSGSANGNVELSVRENSFYYRDRGSASMMIGNKSLSATYDGMADNQVVMASVYGMYDGQNYFARYSFSTNLLPLAMQMSPNTVQRNYGTMTLTAGDQTITRKYDMKGMPLPPQLQ